jgi:hypothetical protein
MHSVYPFPFLRHRSYWLFIRFWRVAQAGQQAVVVEWKFLHVGFTFEDRLFNPAGMLQMGFWSSLSEL